MNVYMYQAALYCGCCGEELCERLDGEGKCPEQALRANGLDEEMYDSDDYPKGPYRDGGGEADSPQHCDSCGTFLENPLTTEGVEYLHTMIRDHIDSPESVGRPEVIDEWIEFYGVTLTDLLWRARPKWMWWFDHYGNFKHSIAKSAAEECTPPGVDASSIVLESVRARGFAVPRVPAINYLKEFGAWSLEELTAMTDEELACKVWWIACGDTKESGEWLGLVH